MIQRYVGCGGRTLDRVGTAVFILWLTFSAVVQADDPPEITTKPQNQHVREGGIASFYCNVRGDPPPVIKWKKNGKLVYSSRSRFSVQAYAGGSMLRIDPIRSGKDDATYECVAENGVGDAVNAEAILSVFDTDNVPSGFPSIQAASSTQVLEKGQSVILMCEVTGNPSPRVRWLRDSMPLDIRSNSRYTLLYRSMPGSLQITNTKEEDTGKYECVAENSIGTEYSKPTQLYVKVRRISPQFTIPPPPMTEVRLGSNLTLQCVAVGSPMPYVKWRKGLTQDLTPEDKLPISKNVLDLYDIRESANYTCIAESALGVIEQTSIVKVQSLPAPPTNVRVSEITANSVRLTWSFNGPEDPSYYVIQFEPRLGNLEYNEISGIATTYYSVKNLSPYTEYELSVIAVNTIGRGPPSASVVVTTSERDPSTAPRNVQVRLLSLSTLVIQWDEPKTPNGQVTGYKVYYATNPTSQMQLWEAQMVGNNLLTTISDLTHCTEYTIRIQAFTSEGPGLLSTPVQVKTQRDVPSQPADLRAIDFSETSITLQWNKSTNLGENIVDYELYWNDTYANKKYHRRIPISEDYVLTGLYPDTLYFVWLAARSQKGEGAITPPVPARTKPQVPSEPLDVRIFLVNLTAFHVSWKGPKDYYRYAVIRGYHVYVQETKEEDKSLLNEPMRFDVVDANTLELTVTALQPDTLYSVQVAALTRKGDGDRSPPIAAHTPGGVPNRPTVNIKELEREPIVSIELEWDRPTNTYGKLLGYLLRYGVKDQPLKEENLPGNKIKSHIINDLERGVEYEFRVAGKNEIGIGQETIKYWLAPEGPPTGPPTNITYSFQTPDIVCFIWATPTWEHRNGQITKYDIQFMKRNDQSTMVERTTNTTKAIFTNLEENTEYVFQVKAYTNQGAGPFSDKFACHTEKDIGRAPLAVHAEATSDSSVEVWWEPVPSRPNIIGYVIFYTMTPVDDLDEWQKKQVAVTESASLVSLEKFAQYAIAVGSRTKSGYGSLSEKVTVKVKPKDVPLDLRAYNVSTHSMTLSWAPPIRLNPIKYKISFDAVKEFVNSQGKTQMQVIPRKEIILEQNVKSYSINELSPFTTYSVNVGALPSGDANRLTAKITVTTQMAAPQPMVKPDFYGVVDGKEIQVILPQASEEYGPIFHYLIIVPEDKNNENINPGQFLTEDIINNGNTEKENSPYIAAKFSQKIIPYTFNLGSGDNYEGFINRKLDSVKRYRIFVRAVVDTPQKHLYTSSPFSEYLSLDMSEVPTGDPPKRPRIDVPGDPNFFVIYKWLKIIYDISALLTSH